MEPAVVSARVFVSPSLFHKKFPHDSPGVSFLRIPANGNYALKKKVDLKQKILFHDGEIRRSLERTPLSSKTLIENSFVPPVKKRRLEFVPVRKKFDWVPRNLVLDRQETIRNDDSVNTASDELATHKEGKNEFNDLRNSASSNRDEDGGETSTLSSPEYWGSTLHGQQGSCATESNTEPKVRPIGAESSVSSSEHRQTDPAKGSQTELPKTPPVTSDECQVVNDKNFNRPKPPEGTHDTGMLEQCSNKSLTESRDFYSVGIAKNLKANGSLTRDAMNKPSTNEVVRVLAPLVHPSSEEIPTVVQEFTGIMGSKSLKRKSKRKEQRSAAVKKRTRREAADSGVTQVTSFAQLTGGKVTVNSTLNGNNGNGPRTPPSRQVQSVSHSDRSASIAGVDDCCVPSYADFLAHSKSLCGSYGCAADVSTIAGRSQFLNYAAEGSKISSETPQICYPEVIRYSASYLRSLVPYRPEGFNNYPHMKFKCVFCSQLFPCLDDLQGHVDQRHYGSNPYECPFCFERFDQIATYSGHLNQHVQLRNYPTFGCQVCSASFSSKWELHLHAVAHGHHFPC